MIIGKTLEFLKDLSEIELENQVYDFHNDYSCQKIKFYNETLTLMFKKRNEGFSLSLKFCGVELTKAIFFNVSTVENLTLDTIYRGRVVVDKRLIELSENGKAYFYLEFYEGQKMEFWSESIIVEKK